eukprot:scaffold18638_cov35-Cyclotella_meneghiniana.AAC.3
MNQGLRSIYNHHRLLSQYMMNCQWIVTFNQIVPHNFLPVKMNSSPILPMTWTSPRRKQPYLASQSYFILFQTHV